MKQALADNGMFTKALAYHRNDKPGKWEIRSTKPLRDEQDLSLAYSPGVADPVREIHRDPDLAYDYTNKGNTVAVISNGTAILGLGNLGALASKPVMEGKAVLFQKFANINSIDLEVESEDPDEFVNCVKLISSGFAGINLEDIKAPESLIIENKLDNLLDIPVFHDDQHGTAVVVVAGLLNALKISGKSLPTAKIIIAGAGSAALAVSTLLRQMGAQDSNIILCDEIGVLNRSRLNKLDKWRSLHISETPLSSLPDIFQDADVAIGLSTAGVFTAAMLKTMAKNPIVFALANPSPEIYPEEVYSVRPDAIVATGRSDYPNQVNNVLCFPYIFRGALDVRASTITTAMKIACANALASCLTDLDLSKHKILPDPFDPSLLSTIAPAVSQAAINDGVSRILKR